MKMSKLDHNSKLGFVGAGMVGKSLALALSKIGYSVVAVSSRSFSSACELAELVCGVTAYQTVQEVANVLILFLLLFLMMQLLSQLNMMAVS